jgi:hypothetical protein
MPCGSATAPAPVCSPDMNRPDIRQLYRSPNGDTWFLAGDPATGLAFVRHQANASSGGNVTDVEIGAFLSEPRHPQHEALLRLIGTLILDPQAADAEDEPPDMDTGREWSDAELCELGDMLLRGLSIEVIARLLRRDHGDIRDKVAEVGPPAPPPSWSASARLPVAPTAGSHLPA